MSTVPLPRLGEPLSARELQVLDGISRGLSNGQIGRKLGITGNTVGTHCRRLFAKLGARDRANAVHLGHRAGVLT